MKRRTALALACILALSLTACGGKKADSKSAETTALTESAGPTLTAESGAESEKQEKGEKPAFRIMPFQAVDKEEYGIKIDNYGSFGEDQEYLQLTLQNKSEDKSYVFVLKNLEGDGIVLPTSGISDTVEPGQEKQVNLMFQKNSSYSLQSFGDLTFRFAIRDSNAQNQKGETDVFHIYPYGENTEVKYVFAPNDSVKPLDDNEIFEAVVTECKQDQFGDENVFFYLRNKTNKRLYINSDKGSVNGETRSTTRYFDVGPGQSLFGFITYQDLTIPEAEIKELQFNLRVQDVDNLAGGPLLDKTYTVTP